MKGTLYVVGVGPGDPELMTIKAMKVVQSADVIACPAKGASPGVAYQIAKQIVPELEQKEVLPFNLPMTGNDISSEYQAAQADLQKRLDAGESIAYLTLGDPGFYSTFYHLINEIICNDYMVEVISGIPSFCAVSARLQVPLVIGKENVLITAGELHDFSGTQVIMKAGTNLRALKERLLSQGKTAMLIENCGMEGEMVYENVEAFPDEAGYFSMIVVRPQDQTP